MNFFNYLEFKSYMLTVIRFISVLSLLFFFVCHASEAYNIENLLGEYAQKADLSSRTKKESAGYVIVFTRSDLDRMKIKTLKELINYIPFLRYNENSAGLSDVNYSPYQQNTINPLIVYINDREVLSPFNGNGFQLIGQMDLSYIDHIEIYLGLPSYEIGFNTAVAVVKMYTKKGYREHANVFGFYGGSYGTYDTYFYKADKQNGHSYLIYMNYRDLKRKKVEHRVGERDYSLSRNKNMSDFYGEVEDNNYRFELQAIVGKLDNFIGKSWNISVNKNKTDFYYIYGGIYYKSDDKTFRAGLNYSYISTYNIQDSDSPLGYVSVPYSSYYFYNHSEIKLEEQMVNAKTTKIFKVAKNDFLLIGARSRFKRFAFTKIKLGYIKIPKNSYDRECVLSSYFENRYFLNSRNLAITSLEADKYIENDGIRDMLTLGGRLGYIFNNNITTLKTFIFFGGFPPSPYIIYHQRLLSKKQLNPQKALAFSGQLIYRHNSSIYSVLCSRTYFEDMIYFSGKEYENLDNREIYDGISAKYTYNINPFNSIIVNLWMYYMHPFNKNTIKGGYVALFCRFQKFDFYNNLSFRAGYSHQKLALNFNTAITYNASNNLSVYIKGNNLLGRAIRTDYYRINPFTGQKTTIHGVEVFDKTIWMGLEYKF